MHEMSLAEGILDISLQYFRQANAQKITEITVLVGEMTNVVPESLSFCFESLSKGTPAEQAVLKLKSMPLEAWCHNCDYKFVVQNYNFTCPHCTSANLEIISGRQLQVESLEVE